MASKRNAKAKGKTKTADDAVKSSEVMKMPPASAVKSIAASITATLKKKGTLSDALRVEIAEAKTQKGIHPGALKRVERLLYKAKNTDRGIAAVATELAHFDYYRDVLGLDELLKKQGQMFARTEAGENEQDAKSSPESRETGNVTPISAAREIEKSSVTA